MALNNVPLSGQNLSQTRVPINQNFTYIENGFIVNHVDWNSGSDAGKHTYVTFTQQSSDPSTIATQIDMYNKADATTSSNEIYIHKSGATAYPMTEVVSGSASATGSNHGWFYTPGGVFVKYGTATATGTTFSEDLNIFNVISGEPSFKSVMLFAIISPAGSTPFNYAVTTCRLVGTVATLTVQVSSSGASFNYAVWGR